MSAIARGKMMQSVNHKDGIMSEAGKTTIYIVSHKDFIAPEMTGYVPILAGAAANHAQIAVKDDKGVNISKKNPQYCELTAQYWVWKNSFIQSDNIGFVHYRRYFYTTKFKSKLCQLNVSLKIWGTTMLYSLSRGFCRRRYGTSSPNFTILMILKWCEMC